MTQQHLLPKFGSGKDAEGKVSTTPESVGGEAPVAVSVAGPAQSEGTRMKAAEMDAKAMPSMDGGQAASASGEINQTASRGRRGRRSGFLTSFLLGWARRKNPFRPKAAQRKAPGPVQGELLLESIQVVRNDLTDTDLEVVAKPEAPPPQAQEAKVPADADPERARLVWRRIATRLFGAKGT